MTLVSRGFKRRARVIAQYGLSEREPEERFSRNLGVTSSVNDSGNDDCTPFFVGSAVKSIGPVYRWVCDSDSAELVALWGSCGKLQEVKSMSQASEPNPLVEALRRKTSYQDERIDELEEQVSDLESTVQALQRDLAEVKE